MLRWTSGFVLAMGLALAVPARGDDAKPTEVTVRASPRKRDPGRSTVRGNDARQIAGTRDDALRVVESLPGVARNAFFGGSGLVLWGAAPGDSRILVDGVEVPALYHERGLRGILPSGLVQTIDLVPGAYDAEYGRALGGLVRVTTKELPREGFHASVGADFLDAGAIVTAAVDDRVRFAGAARVSYLDRLADAAVSREILDIVPIPRYHDMQLKVSLALRENEELSAVVLGSGDSLVRLQPSADPANVRKESTENSFYRYYLHYTHTLDHGAHVVVTPFWGYDDFRRDASFGGVPQVREHRAFRYGLRASYRAPIANSLTFTLGVDAQATRSALFRQGSLTLPPREGDLYVFGQPPGTDVNADAWNSNLVDVGPFVTAEWRHGPFLVAPSVRADVFLLETSRQTPRVGQTPAIGLSRLLPALDPRIALYAFLTNRLSLSLRFGLYHQAPDPEDVSAVFGTPDLGLSRALQTSAGAALRLPLEVDVETSGFYVMQDKLVVRSRLPTPKLARALTQDGEGRVWGVQVLARRQFRNGFHGWIAYTASRSVRRYAGDSSFRLFDQDQSHVLTTTAGYVWRGWTFGARFRYATGSPRTPVQGSFFDLSAGNFQPVFGPRNSTRLPDFVALDLRVQKSLPLGRMNLTGYIDWTNVTNHDNPEEIVYNFDYSNQGYLLGLPTLIIAGARAEW